MLKTSLIIITAFLLASFTSPQQNDEFIDGNEDYVFTVVEEMPEYPGGNTAMMKYMDHSLNCNMRSSDGTVRSKIYLSFIVEKDGSISTCELLRKISPSCDKNVISMVESMPKWKAGKQKGRTVRVKFMLPIYLHPK
jgi:protein TonB